ncbi:MAG: TetR-like C-terminal domain-containing protein, partial [Clostridia bacterium]
MPKFTKTAIMNSFMKLLSTTSFDKITVKNIVDDCGINRNTFYYNFEDIYALVDEILQEEVRKIEEMQSACHSWNEGLLQAADFALQNRNAVFHLYNSSKRPQLEKYLQKVVYDVVSRFVRQAARDVAISETNQNFVADFYTCTLMGLLRNWLDGGMEEDFTDVIKKTGVLFESNIRQ